MPKNHDLHVKLTESQKKEIAENTQAAGFKSLSDFVRHVAIEQGYTMEQRIREIHQAIISQKSQAGQKYTAMPRTYEQQTQSDRYGAKPVEYDPSGQNNYS